ncbi:MAG: TolC family protein, partial [Porticoccaceae bacterium]
MRLVKQGLCAVSTTLLLAQISWADSLKDIYESALQNDPVLSAARASFNADREVKNISRAALLPQLSIAGEYTESENNENSQQIVVIQNESIPSIRKGLTDSNQT